MKAVRTRKPPRPLESEVQRSAIAILQGLGWLVLRRNTGAFASEHKGKRRFVRFSEPGASDLYGLTRSTPHSPHAHHFELEIKRPGEWPTDAQLLWLADMSAHGAIAFWADNTADVERVARHVMDGGRIELFPTGQYKLVGGEG